MNEASIANIKPNTNVLLTERDFGVLLGLYENVVMTYSQIARKHFASAQKPTVLNRLAKLESLKVLKRERIPRMHLGLDDHAIGVVFQVTRDGISRLRSRFLDREFKPQPIRIHPYTLHHDLILVDLADALRSRFASAAIVNGKFHESINRRERSLEPDLIMQFPNARGVVAIELELSDKSERRYREIVLRYRLSEVFEKVIYFTGNPFIKSIMTRVILNRTPQREEIPMTDKFYFSPHMEFINSPSQVPISNGANDDLGQTGGGI
jgi:DNA-binding Lrp family transcriptional regulator